MPTILILGNLSEGFRYVGPFEDHDEAVSYDDGNHGGMGWVATLEQPTQKTN